eukprot:6459757-Amphidinium_carterae.1
MQTALCHEEARQKVSEAEFQASLRGRNSTCAPRGCLSNRMAEQEREVAHAAATECDERPMREARMLEDSTVTFVAYGGPANDPQVTADLNTIGIWKRRVITGPNYLDVWAVAENRDLQGLETGPATQAFRHLRKAAKSIDAPFQCCTCRHWHEARAS